MNISTYTSLSAQMYVFFKPEISCGLKFRFFIIIKEYDFLCLLVASFPLPFLKSLGFFLEESGTIFYALWYLR